MTLQKIHSADQIRHALAGPLLLLVWGFAIGALLWGSGVDASIQLWLQDNYVQGFNNVMRMLGELGKGTMQIGICVGFGVLWTIRRWNQGGMYFKGIRTMMAAVPVFLIAGVLNWLLKYAIGRGRPKEFLWNGESAYAMKPFASSAQWWSFPSGHSCSTFAIAVWLGLAFPRYRWIFWGVATVLSFSRFLALTPHYFGDVIAGAAVGAAVALAVWNVRQLYQRSDSGVRDE